MKNLEIAKILYDIADILEIQDVAFKPQAYRKAARSIETSAEDIEEIAKQGKLEDLPGVGKSIAEKVQEYLETGRLKYYEEIKKQIPKHLSEFIAIPGMGPKKAKHLHEKLRISTIAQLEKAAKEHKIRKLPGFGEKSEEDILKGIELVKRGQERMLLGRALSNALEIESRLKKLKDVIQINIAGSLRRRQETIGDVDILASAKKPEPVMDYFTTMPDVARVLAKGSTKSSILLKNNLQIDLRVIDDNVFGAALQYFTGNKDHNIKLREIAIKKGYKLSEYGLFYKKTNKLIASRTEQEVYKKLGMQYPEPEIRENRGEIEAAIKNQLPKLLAYDDIKGDFHVHTKATDGTNTVEQLVDATKKLGYEYIAITDHSKNARIAGGLSDEEMLKHLKNIKSYAKKLKNFRLLAGSEVDILKNGDLDYSDKLLRQMDIVIAAVHSGFKSSREEMTNRILRAMDNENMDILAHPTGRLINQREPYEIDLQKIFKKAAEKNIYLEIDSLPERLDLKDVHIMAAKEFGAKFVIDTDTHSLETLHYMELGIATARRGWCEKKDIVNTCSAKELPKFFKRIR